MADGASSSGVGVIVVVGVAVLVSVVVFISLQQLGAMIPALAGVLRPPVALAPPAAGKS